MYQDSINDIYCDNNQEYFPANHDGNQLLYVDFENKTVVSTLPNFVDHVSWDTLNAYAYNEMKEFQDDMEDIAGQLGYPPEAKEPPVSVMYVRNEVRLGSENTLISYVTGFYPPRLTVKWTRNNNNVTQGVSSSQVHINNDGSFNQFSILKFTPQEGDMYTCTVEHSALEGPLTRYWDVEVPESSPSVFCGVGLTLGLLGVATGTFFFVKGKESAGMRTEQTSHDSSFLCCCINSTRNVFCSTWYA
ncbi:H-2 class II histocompatibility antigen, A-R alpha chain-like [Clupea harengus]|uniref:H-2 class II histocompatibility antigen, A-R alpha chain-like n=1 Tax=Clupea harengus TaxID=7950 RepID=A0A6P8FL09_CLUHA|nr:H-2 class II histocompatibility antigen, A-R alpha chain-like [Clupea harengus]